MRYAQLRKMDISNGLGVGVALFVQGCSFHCTNCFNQETWDFAGGKEWDSETENQMMKLIDKPYITRVSFLGGEPLHSANVDTVIGIIHKIKHQFPDKKIWVYTGFLAEDIFKCYPRLVGMIDVMVDGQYMDALRDITLKFRGSSNQRVIDVKKSVATGKIIELEW